MPWPASSVDDVPTARRHLLFVLSGAVAERIDRFRQRFDPDMAGRSPAHLTLIYPEEHDDETRLLERIRVAVGDVEPFPVEVAGLNHNPATGGVWLRVEDPTGAWGWLRGEVLRPPFRPLPVEPHVTVVHPRTSRRGPEALAALQNERIEGPTWMHEVVYTDNSAAGMRVLGRFPLTGIAEQVVVGLLRRGDRLLMVHRHPQRESFPDVWDLPGGHVEPGETRREALRRELEEELGVRAGRAEEWTSLRLGAFDLILFLVAEWSGEPRNLAPAEHDRLRWVGTDELAQLRLVHAGYLPLLRRVAAG